MKFFLFDDVRRPLCARESLQSDENRVTRLLMFSVTYPDYQIFPFAANVFGRIVGCNEFPAGVFGKEVKLGERLFPFRIGNRVSETAGGHQQRQYEEYVYDTLRSGRLEKIRHH
jgi:hypothetical protein